MQLSKSLFLLTSLCVLFACQGTGKTDELEKTEPSRKDSAQQVKAVKKAVKEDLEVYLTAKQEGDYDKMLDKTYDGIFEITSRDSVRKKLKEEKLFKEVDFSFKLTEVSPTVEDNGKEVVVAKYIVEKNITLKEDEPENPEVIEEFFKERYGRKVDYDEETRTFHIESEEVIYAIQKDGEDEWKFMTYEQTQTPAYRKVLSLETYKKLIRYE